MEPMIVSVANAASLLDLSARQIRLLIERGELSHVRQGRRIGVPVSDLREYVDRNASREYVAKQPGGRPRKHPVSV